MEESEILLLYEIQYSDLMLLGSIASSSSSSCSNYQQKTIMENLGPTGPGLIAVTNVPDESSSLLLASWLLSPKDRKHTIRGHNLGSDFPLKNPDRNVSSFAMQLKV